MYKFLKLRKIEQRKKWEKEFEAELDEAYRQFMEEEKI